MMQVMPRPSKKARNSINGDPDWKPQTAPVVLEEDLVNILKEGVDRDGVKKGVLDVAYEAGLGIKLDELADDGGGWTLACSKAGAISSMTYDITWTLKCRSANCLGCPAKTRLVFRSATRQLVLESATGWLHTHEGESMSKQGIPPNVKALVDKITQEQPTLKFAGVCNLLFEQHSIPTALKERIKNYFYKGAEKRRAEHLEHLGVSSYGSVASWAEANMLFDRLQRHVPSVNHEYLDVAGVVGVLVRPEIQHCAVIMSTPKLLLDMWAHSQLGYNEGTIHLDHTFKLLHEDIPFLVISGSDIGQHVHLGAMGPVTHRDTEMTTFCIEEMKKATDRLLEMIAHDSDECWPAAWPEALRDALKARYFKLVLHYVEAMSQTDDDGALIDCVAPTYEVVRSMSDADQTLPNSVKQAFKHDDVVEGMCWVHVWRGTKANHKLLLTNTEERQKELYTDLAFIHHTTVPELVRAMLLKFDDKWRLKYGEIAMAEYVKKTWSTKLWQRAYSKAGDPTDNNTLESLNRVLKTDENFNTRNSIGHALPHALTVVYRRSRDTKPIMLAPPTKKKDWAKAQKLVDSKLFELAYKMNDKLVIPSEKLMRTLPGKTVAEMRQNIRVWISEYIHMMKNPGGYAKVHGPSSWEFDTLVDYAFSFWTIERIPTSHTSWAALAKEGIMYSCTCPEFTHYHKCKHVIGHAIFKSEKTVPALFSNLQIGDRKTQAGARLSHRGHCLMIDE
jgi:hypothetical protein